MPYGVGVLVRALIADQKSVDRIRRIFTTSKDRTSRSAAVRAYCRERLTDRIGELNTVQRILLDSLLHNTHWGEVTRELERSNCFHRFALDPAPSLGKSPEIKRSDSEEDFLRAKVIFL